MNLLKRSFMKSFLMLILISVIIFSMETIVFSQDLSQNINNIDLFLFKLSKFDHDKTTVLIEVPGNVSIDSVNDLLKAMNIKVLDRLDLVRTLVAEVSVRDLLRINSYIKNVRIYPDLVLKLFDDERFLKTILYDNSLIGSSSTDLYAPNASRYLVQAPLMWSKGYTGKDVKVAVIDTGIQSRHPWLIRPDNTSVVAFHYDVTNDTLEYCEFHGTHVAGIIAAQFDSFQKIGIGSNYTYPGVAPDSIIYDIKVFNSSYEDCESTKSSWIIKGLEIALTGPDGKPNTGDEADIISMSLGGLVEPYIIPYIKTHPLIQALSKAASMNKLVVIAAGNYGPGGYTINYMCVASGVICVAASGDQWSLDVNRLFIAFFSSRGPIPWDTPPLMISAPGIFVISSIPTDYRPPYVAAAASGTSMATPHVSGVLALLRQALSTASSKDLVIRLMNSGLLYKNKGLYEDIYPWNRYLITLNQSILAAGDPYKDPNPMVEGFGFVRAYDALSNMIQVTYETGDLVRNLIIEPGESRNIGKVYIRNIGSNKVSVSLYVVGFESYGGFSNIKGSIDISPNQIMIQPLSTGVVDLRVNIDKNIFPGTYSGYIVAVARTEDGREFNAKIILSVTVPLKIDSQYPRVSLQTFAGLSAEPLYYLGISSPEWISFIINVSQIPSTPLLLRFVSKDSLVNMHIDDLMIIPPTNEFISLATGNILFEHKGYHVLVIGWLYGAYDEGTLSIDLYSSSASPEIILSSVSYNISSLYKELDELRSRLSSLELNISQISSNISEINNVLRNTRLDIEDLRLKINDLNSSIIDLRDYLVRYIEDLNKTVYIEVNELYTRYTMLNESLRNYNTSLSEITKNVGILYDEVSNLRNNVEKTSLTLSQEVSDLKSYVDNNLRIYVILISLAFAISIISLLISLYIVIRRKSSS